MPSIKVFQTKRSTRALPLHSKTCLTANLGILVALVLAVWLPVALPPLGQATTVLTAELARSASGVL